MRIYPSLISADILYLASILTELEPHCDGFHLDVMDHHFVPNLTMGPAFINAIDAATIKPNWIHLMVEKPSLLINALEIKDSTIITFHYETQENKKELVKKIKTKGALASMALNPDTPVEKCFEHLADLDQILIMLVEPGFSGQQMAEHAAAKIELLSTYIKNNGFTCRIGVDGGVKKDNIKELLHMGAQDFAIASGIFASDNPVTQLEALKKSA